MTCITPESTPDWKAYALGEMNSSAQRDAEAHAANCVACRDELTSLRIALDALSVLREEEIPRRIGFVSDQVFEPRWWQRAFRLTFASPTFSAACIVAAAILVHAFVGNRPSDAVSQAQIDAAVTKAVAQVEARNAQMLADYEMWEKRVTQIYVASNGIVRQ